MADNSWALASNRDCLRALSGGVACGCLGRGQPQRQRDGVRYVGVNRDGFFGLRDDGRLLFNQQRSIR